MGGEATIFYKMLGRLETITLLPCLTHLKTAFDGKDTLQFSKKAHELKGSCGYVGAGRLYFACVQILQKHTSDELEAMLSLYPTLIEAAVEYRVHSRFLVAEHKSNQIPAKC